MPSPRRLPSVFTLFGRLFRLRDWLAGLFRPTFTPRRARLSVEGLEVRVVPTVSVWADQQIQTVSEGTTGNPFWWGSPGVITLERNGDISQNLNVQVQLGSDGADPLAAWDTDFTLSVGGVELNPDTNGVADVTFGANQSQVQVVVAAKTDKLIEGTQGFQVTVLNGDGYTAGNPMGSGGSGGSGGWNGGTADVRILDVPAVVTISQQTQMMSEG